MSAAREVAFTTGATIDPQVRSMPPRMESARSSERPAMARPAVTTTHDGLARATAEALTVLEEAAAAAEAAATRALSVAEVLGDALAILEAARGSALPAGTDGSRRCGGQRLSPREREVLALVIEGRSNKAIAEALYVSPNTVKTHVASLMRKLDASTRAHLAAIAARDRCA